MGASAILRFPDVHEGLDGIRHVPGVMDGKFRVLLCFMGHYKGQGKAKKKKEKT